MEEKQSESSSKTLLIVEDQEIESGQARITGWSLALVKCTTFLIGTFCDPL